MQPIYNIPIRWILSTSHHADGDETGTHVRQSVYRPAASTDISWLSKNFSSFSLIYSWQVCFLVCVHTSVFMH